MGDPALPHSSAPGPTWKPNPVALWVKPATAPTRVLLQGTPLSRGLYVLTGCRMTVLGVTWLQPWVPRKPSLGAPESSCALPSSSYPRLDKCRHRAAKYSQLLLDTDSRWCLSGQGKLSLDVIRCRHAIWT